MSEVNRTPSDASGAPPSPFEPAASSAQPSADASSRRDAVGDHRKRAGSPENTAPRPEAVYAPPSIRQGPTHPVTQLNHGRLFPAGTPPVVGLVVFGMIMVVPLIAIVVFLFL